MPLLQNHIAVVTGAGSGIGRAIASGYAVSPALGALVFGAVTLHKVPEGLAIASMFLAAGASRRAAYNLILGALSGG